jgi:hypothetical protein
MRYPGGFLKQGNLRFPVFKGKISNIAFIFSCVLLTKSKCDQSSDKSLSL